MRKIVNNVSGLAFAVGEEIVIFPMPFQFVDLGRQTKSEQRQEIHRRMRSLHCCPVSRTTSQKLVLRNDNGL